MRRIVILILLIATFCLGAAFSYHNPQIVELNYLAGNFSPPLGALLMAVVAGTVGLMVLIYAVLGVPRRAELARLRRRLEKAESELVNLRNLPLQDG